MAEEKEASTAASTLTSLEDLITIMCRAQTVLDELHIANVLLESLHEQFSLMVDHLDV